MNRFFAIFLLFNILLTATACQKEKISTGYYDTVAVTPDEAFFSEPELILKATVEKINKEYFTNPNGTLRSEAGEVYQNAHITVYELKISELYKGSWDFNTIELKLFNGKGMSPELYLYGEDDQYTLDEEVEKFLLEVGNEYILGLATISASMRQTYGDDGGYCLRFGDSWCFVQNEEGFYENIDTGINHRTFDIATLKEKIAAAI